MYIREAGERFLIYEKEAFLTYKCIKVTQPGMDRDDVLYPKKIESKKGLFFYDANIEVRLISGGTHLYWLSPLAGYLYVVTRYYKLAKWYLNHKWAWEGEKNKKTISRNRNRIRVLEELVGLYEAHLERDVFVQDQTVTIQALAHKLTGSKHPTATLEVTQQLGPILASLESEEIIHRSKGGLIKLEPKAWSELSKYFVEERRHSDNQDALKWQRRLTVLLVLGSAMMAFLTFMRSDVRDNATKFFSSLF